MKKLLFFRIVLFISIIGLITFSLLFILYIYDIIQINKTSKNLANSFSISYLYVKNDSYLSTAKDNKDSSTPFVIGIIKIDKIKLDYPILSEESDELLKIAPCRFAGPLPNNIGNLCIAGHNYIDNTFFTFCMEELFLGRTKTAENMQRNLMFFRIFFQCMQNNGGICLINIPDKNTYFHVSPPFYGTFVKSFSCFYSIRIRTFFQLLK